VLRPLAVLVDADGVLQHPAADRRERFAAILGPRLGLGDLYDQENRCINGEGPVLANLGRLMRAHASPGTVADLVRVWTDISLDRDVLMVVREVRRAGVRAYLASNQLRFRGEYMKVNLPYGHELDGEFYSYDLNSEKPKPEFFLRICERIGVVPHRAVIVDDLERNVVGGRDVGLTGILFDREGGAGQLRRDLVAVGALL
jgi:putative hydrolase of the HAD superfamily